MRLWTIWPLAAAITALMAGGLAVAPAADRPPPGAASCSGCHGAGEGAPPPLDRLSAAQIEAALAGFRDGTRTGTMMPRIARGFTPSESRAIAAFLGGATDTEK